MEHVKETLKKEKIHLDVEENAKVVNMKVRDGKKH
jgi:hypothetical protein